MLKAIKKLLEHKYNAYIISLALTVVIIYLSLSPNAGAIMPASVSDKVLHAFAYTVLALSWFYAIKKAHDNTRVKIVIAISIFIFGIIIEVLQEWLAQGRMMDFKDVIANTIGILVAFSIFKYLLRGYKLI